MVTEREKSSTEVLNFNGEEDKEIEIKEIKEIPIAQASELVEGEEESEEISKRKISLGENKSLEAILIGLILIGLLIEISLLTDSMGALGEKWQSVMFGLFGLGGMLLPALVIAYSVWILVDKDRDEHLMRIGGISLFFVAFCSGIEVIHSSDVDHLIFADQLIVYYDEGGMATGGVLGGVIGGLIARLLGELGGTILIFITLLFALICITKQSIVYAMIDKIQEQKNLKSERVEKMKVVSEEVKNKEESAIQAMEQTKQKADHKKATKRKSNRRKEAKEERESSNQTETKGAIIDLVEAKKATEIQIPESVTMNPKSNDKGKKEISFKKKMQKRICHTMEQSREDRKLYPDATKNNTYNIILEEESFYTSVPHTKKDIDEELAYTANILREVKKTGDIIEAQSGSTFYDIEFDEYEEEQKNLIYEIEDYNYHEPTEEDYERMDLERTRLHSVKKQNLSKTRVISQEKVKYDIEPDMTINEDNTENIKKNRG